MTAERRHEQEPNQRPATDPTSAAKDKAGSRPDYALSFKDGQLLPVRTHLVGGPQDGRVDLWFTFSPWELPEGWVFPRRVQTPEGEVLVEDHYRRRPGQALVYGREVVYNFGHTSVADQGSTGAQ